MDEEAKKRWQRAKPTDKVIGLPGYLVGGQWVGTMDDFEDAVETGTLETFLKQDTDVGAGGSGNVEDDELEALMREMTSEDLDKLASDIVPSAPAGTAAAAAATVTAPLATAAAAAGVVSEQTAEQAKQKVETAAAQVQESVEAAVEPAKDTAGKIGLLVPAGEPAPAPQPLEAGVMGGGEVVKDEAKIVDAQGAVVSTVEKVVAAAPDAGSAAAAGAAVENEDGPAPGEKTLDDVVDEAVHADGKEKLD